MTSSETTELATVPASERDRLERTLGRLDRLARLMDEQFELPVLGYRVGLDPILGVIPGGGDWATWVVGVYIFWESLRLDTPKGLLTRMVVNLTIDLVVGYIPALGDLFDAAFKANRRNVDLLLEFYGVNPDAQEPRLPSDLPARVEQERGKPKLVRYLAGFVVVLVLFGLAALPIVLLWWLIKG